MGVDVRQSCDITKNMVIQNLAETIGFMWFLKTALRTQEGGLGLLGTPCNSFNWMCCSQHRRSLECPWGDLRYPFVRLGNLLASRSCLVVLTLICRSVFFLLENPATSKIAVFPPVMHIMSIMEIEPLRVFWSGPHVHNIFVHKLQKYLSFLAMQP